MPLFADLIQKLQANVYKTIQTGEPGAGLPLLQLHFSIMFSDWSRRFDQWVHLLSVPGVCLFTAVCFSSHTTLTFNMGKAKFNTLRLWLLLQKSIWLSWLRVCWNQLPAEERRGVCMCVCLRGCLGGGQGELIHKSRHRLDCSLF